MIDYKTAELIASRIYSRRKEVILMKSSFGFELKQPYQVRDSHYKDPDYVGTYVKGVTAEQIMVDWGHDE